MGLVIKIDTKSKAAMIFAEYVKTLSYVQIVEETSTVTPYEKKILDSYKTDKRRKIKTKNIWDSIK